MAKCGKGCMPECEYFTTGGCVSLFNCPYKIEENYQNSAFTSGNSNFLNGIEKWFMQLVEEGKLPQTPMNYDMASYKAYVAHLEAENAALKERLKKAVELPVPLGAFAICIRKISVWDGVPPKKHFKWVLAEELFTIDDIPNTGRLWFPNTEEGRKQAEERLKELQGE